MKNRMDLDNEVARELGLKRATVSRITKAFLQAATNALVEEHYVHLDGFCRLMALRVKAAKGTIDAFVANRPKYKSAKKPGRMWRIYAKKTVPLKQALRERAVP